MNLRERRRETHSKRDLDLDFVRGVAILLAMGWHFNSLTGVRVVDLMLAPGREIGWAGVDLFFVLSGFLVGSLLLREVEQRASFDAKLFLGRRALRLWPVLYVYLAAELFIGEHPWRSYLWQNLLHIQNYTGTPLAQMWSLAVEEHFYLALAVFMPLWTRYSRNPATLVRILAGLIIIPVALRAIAVALHTDPLVVQTNTHFRVDALAAGVLLAVLAVHYPRDFEALLALRPIWMIITIAGCIWLVHVPKSSAIGQTIGYSISWITSAAFLLTMRRASFIQRARFVSVPIAVLGTNAYALYIWHASCAGIVTKLFEHGVHQSPLLVIIAKYGLSIMVAGAVSRVVERPGLALRERFFPRPSQEEPLPAIVGVSPISLSEDAKTITIEVSPKHLTTGQ